MNTVDENTAKSVAKVLERILEKERDSDHVRTIEDSLDRLWVIHGTVLDVDPTSVKPNDVKETFDFLEDQAPTQTEIDRYKSNNNGNRHPDRVFNYVKDFVRTNEQYVNGCLPSFRQWEAEYVCDGQVIEKRVYDHSDKVPTDPVINGLRYECDRTSWGDESVTVYVSEDPVRNDVDIVINATGDDFINLEAHDGPNVKSGEHAIEKLGGKFNWGMLGDTDIIIKDDPSNVIEFIEQEGWVFERS